MKTLRRLSMGIMTVLGLRRLGFFIPYRYARFIPPFKTKTPYGPMAALFHNREENFIDMLHVIHDLSSQLRAIGHEAPPQPRWAQDWFPRLDAMAAYAMVRWHKPKRIVEVGSGHSTRFFARAAHDGGLHTQITAIDPAPRADIADLNVRLIRETVQSAGLAPFEALVEGDMVSIDSSHILMPNSDVDFLLNGVLAKLDAGVIVHIHDIFLPEDYPASWSWRGYNEQLAVAALLQGGAFDVLWSSRYVVTHMPETLAKTPVLSQIECPDGAYESSLWLQKRHS